MLCFFERRKSWRETSLGDNAAAPAKSSPEGKSGRETSLKNKAAAAAKSSPEGKSGRETSLKNKAAAAAKSSPEGKSGREASLKNKAAAAAKSSAALLLISEIAGNLSPGYSCSPVSQASLAPWFPFWAALGYSRLVSQPCLLSRWAGLWLLMCFPSLSSFFLGCSWLQLSPCLPVLSSFSPFMILYLWFLCLYTFWRHLRVVSHALLAYRT